MNIVNTFLIYWTFIGLIYMFCLFRFITADVSEREGNYMWKISVIIGGPIVWILILIAKVTDRSR